MADDLRDRLERILAEPPETAADAERAARAAEALAEYLRLEEKTRPLLEGGDGIGAPRPRDVASGPLAGVALHEAARRVLEEAGVPLHVRELGKRVKARGWTHKRSAAARPDQINYQLAARLPRYPDIFVRVSPNTFGLRKWATDTHERPKPRLGLAQHAGKPTAREIAERSDAPLAAERWRSS